MNGLRFTVRMEADKAAYLGRQAKANRHFVKAFHDEVADDLTVLDRGNAPSATRGRAARAERRMVRNSSLYRLYRIGAAQIRKRGATGSLEHL